MDDASIAILWTFRVPPERVTEFRQAYGPDGAWAELFRRGDGYCGTELLEADDGGSVFITIDRWRSHSDFADFKRMHLSAYEELDRRLAGLTATEEHIGIFRTEKPSLLG